MASAYLRVTGALIIACATRAVEAMVLAHSTREVPQGKKFALVLRGETFRFGYFRGNWKERRDGCSEDGKPLQLRCTTSVIEKIVEPLERHGNTIEVFFTSVLPKKTRYSTVHKPDENMTEKLHECPLDDILINAFQANSTRVVKKRTFETRGQADTMLRMVNNLNNEYGGVEGVSAHFDYVMIVRNDMYWFKAIDDLHADFRNVTVLSRCAPGMPAKVAGPECVHDTFWMMPGPLYGDFVSSIGRAGCFSPKVDPWAHGHACQPIIKAAIAKSGHVGGFGWLEDGQRRIRPLDHDTKIDNVESWKVADLIEP